MSTNKNITFKKLEQILNKKKRVILSTHVNPDGDGLGTEIAFYHYLSSKGIDCRIINSSPTPSRLSFLDPEEIIYVYNNNLDKWIQGSDLFIAFDIGDYKRLMELGKRVKGKIPVICFDHHPLLHEELYSYIMVDIKSPATGYTFWKYLKEVEYKDRIPKNIATPLYVSLICDTGSFKYESTTTDTHIMAANLIESGVDSYSIQKRIYDANSLAHVKLLGHIINNLNFVNKNQIVWSLLDDKILNKYNATSDDVDGITDYMRAIDGVRVAFLIRKVNSTDMKLNFRSQDVIINDIAGIFNGGGHKYAAGAFIKDGNPISVKNIILKELNKKIQ